jgi:hypothetical protein
MSQMPPTGNERAQARFWQDETGSDATLLAAIAGGEFDEHLTAIADAGQPRSASSSFAARNPSRART